MTMQLTQLCIENEDAIHPSRSSATIALLERPIRVLQVEDDPEATALVRLYLETEGDRFIVTSKSTLRDAMELLVEPKADVILLDLGMPELSGYKSYRALAIATVDSIPIVVYTGNENSATRQLVQELGAMDYLIKDRCTATQLRQSLYDAVMSFPHNRRLRTSVDRRWEGESPN
jgi:DNA-binding NarL/FixJ family response regulator